MNLHRSGVPHIAGISPGRIYGAVLTRVEPPCAASRAMQAAVLDNFG